MSRAFKKSRKDAVAAARNAQRICREAVRDNDVSYLAVGAMACSVAYEKIRSFDQAVEAHGLSDEPLASSLWSGTPESNRLASEFLRLGSDRNSLSYDQALAEFVAFVILAERGR